MHMFFLVLVFLSLYTSANALTVEQKQLAVSNRKWMVQQSKKSSDGFISLTSSSFQKYMLGEMRMFPSILYITTKDSTQCPPCASVRSILSQLAKAYKESQFPGGKSDPKHYLFFTELSHSQSNAKTFSDLKIKTIPLIVFLDSRTEASSVDTILQDESNIFSLQGATLQSLINWISEKSGVPAPELSQSESPQQRKASGGVGISQEGFIALALIVIIPLIYFQRNNPMVYFAAAVLVFLFSISAGMYNVIRKVPFTTINKDGSTMYFTGGSQQQLGAGGYIAGSMQVAIGLIMVLLPSLVMKQKNPTIRHGGMIISAVAMYYIFSMLRVIYSNKMGGYNAGWVWSVSNLW